MQWVLCWVHWVLGWVLEGVLVAVPMACLQIELKAGQR